MGARANRLRNFVGAMFFAYGMLTFLLMFAIGMVWQGNAAHSPDPAHGVVYHMAGNTGRYYTAFQTSATALALWSFGIGMVVALIVIPRQPGAGVRRWLTSRADDPYRAARPGLLAGIALALIGVLVIGAPLVRWLNAMGVVLAA